MARVASSRGPSTKWKTFGGVDVILQIQGALVQACPDVQKMLANIRTIK
jgi:hypothetical protein